MKDYWKELAKKDYTFELLKGAAFGQWELLIEDPENLDGFDWLDTYWEGHKELTVEFKNATIILTALIELTTGNSDECWKAGKCYVEESIIQYESDSAKLSIDQTIELTKYLEF